MKARQEYLGGYQTDKGAVRKYLLTIVSGEHQGKSFYQETHTPKKGFMEWGEPETSYYWNDDSPMFKSVEELLKNPLNQ